MPKPRPIRHAADLLSATHVSTKRAAAVLAREPESPVTQAVKLWGDDEAPFKNLIAAETPLARRWRGIMRRLLAHLERDLTGQTVYRGWSFANARQRTAFMKPILEQGFFVNARIGMSATRSLAVSTSAPFLNVHGAIWEIRAPRKARNLEPIFAAIGAKYPEQREVIFPRGCRFGLLEPSTKLKVVRGGQILRAVLYFRGSLMTTELKKLTATMAEIKRRYPSGGKRYSTIVENPFESGYWPLPKPTKADLTAMRRFKKKHPIARRHKKAA